MKGRVGLFLILAVLFGAVTGAPSGTVLMNDSGSIPAGPATLIFYNGVVVPMDAEGKTAQAIAITSNRILAVGGNGEVLALAGPDTELIDLQGRAVFPGFIDPHTHIFTTSSWKNLTPDEAQELAIESGLTCVTEMHVGPWNMDGLLTFAQAGNLRLRMSLYLTYNDSCGAVHGTWYEKYPPLSELAPRLRMGGVKMLAELSLCGDAGVKPVFSQALQARFPANAEEDLKADKLLFSEQELTSAIRQAQEKGYQVAIHAIGDLGVEESLRAIANALGGRPNDLRHMVLHNYFIRDDMLPLYAQYGILAAVEPTTPCYGQAYGSYVGAENIKLFKRWRELVATGAHVTLDSDWPSVAALSPLKKLAAVVGQSEIMVFEGSPPCAPLPVDQTLSVWQGLQMMTTEAAFALHLDQELGTLTPGKLADLVVLSKNPLDVQPSEITDIQVLLTMIDGKIEYDPVGLVPPARTSGPDQPANTEGLGGPTPAESVSGTNAGPRVVFDEAHNERNTLSAERARLSDPQHPEWYLYASLQAQLVRTYSVEGNVAPLSDSSLGIARVLVLAVPEASFTPAEIENIKGFVRAGGGLLLLGDGFPSEALNSVAGAFGVHFLPGVIASQSGDWDPQSYWTESLDNSHPITQGNQPFHTNWGCAIELTAPGVELVHSGPNTWNDADNDGDQDPDERTGPFTVAVALEFGKGRVVAIGDNAFHDDMFLFSGNRALILNAITWLAP